MKSYNFYKWRIWSILALSFILSLFHRGAMGAISSDITKDLNLTAYELGNIASVTFYVYALMQIPAGLLLDYYGYKKISYLGIFITGLGSILVGMSFNGYLAYVGRLFIGGGTSVIFISVLKAQNVWFSKKEFTKVSGALSFIGNLGGVFATFPLVLLVNGVGWRYSMIIMGIICTVIGILIVKYVENSPTDYGYQCINSPSNNNKMSKMNIKLSIKKVCKSKATWRSFFTLFTLVGCTTTLTGLWGISYLINVYGISNTEAAFITAFIVYGLCLGSLFLSRAEKIFKDINDYPRLASILVSFCWFYILFIEKGKPPLNILPVIFFVIGFLAMSHIVAFTDINNKVNPENCGLATSIVNSGEFIGSSVISILIGFFLDLTWNGTIIDGVRYYEASQYVTTFYIFFIISLLGVVTSFIGREDCKTQTINNSY